MENSFYIDGRQLLDQLLLQTMAQDTTKSGKQMYAIYQCFSRYGLSARDTTALLLELFPILASFGEDGENDEGGENGKDGESGGKDAELP